MKKGIVTIGGVIFVIIVKHPFDGWCQNVIYCWRQFTFDITIDDAVSNVNV